MCIFCPGSHEIRLMQCSLPGTTFENAARKTEKPDKPQGDHYFCSLVPQFTPRCNSRCWLWCILLSWCVFFFQTLPPEAYSAETEMSWDFCWQSPAIFADALGAPVHRVHNYSHHKYQSQVEDASPTFESQYGENLVHIAQSSKHSHRKRKETFFFWLHYLNYIPFHLILMLIYMMFTRAVYICLIK